MSKNYNLINSIMNTSLKSSLPLFIIICSSVAFYYSLAEINVRDAERFEECVFRIMSRYPFLTKENRGQVNKFLRKYNYRLKKDPTGLSRGMEIRHFGKDLSSLVFVNDSWTHTREVAYISAIERCSLLITGTPDSELVKEAAAFVPLLENKSIYVAEEKREPFGRKEKKKKTSSQMGSDSKTNLQFRVKRDMALFEFPTPLINNQRIFHVETPLESIVLDNLLRSPIFTGVFHLGMPQQDAKSYSALITEAGLAGFDMTVINDAINAVAHDIDMSYTSLDSNSENYAFVISREIGAILRLHDLITFADGTQIANNMIYKLATLVRNQSSTPLTPSVEPNSRLQPGRFNESLVPTNTNPLVSTLLIHPSPVTRLQPKFGAFEFQNMLAHLLSESHEMSNLFCTDQSQNIFRIINKAFSEFGIKVSFNTALAVKMAFDEFSPELACSQYANVISEVVRNVLFDNGLLESVDPLEILNKLVSSASTNFELPFPVQNGPDTQVLSEGYKSYPPLLPSFTEMSAPSYQQPVVKEEYPNLEIPDLALEPSSEPNHSSSIQNSNPIGGYISISDDMEHKDNLPIQTPYKHIFNSNSSQESELKSGQPSETEDELETYTWDFEIALQKALSHSIPFLSAFNSGIQPDEAASFASAMIKAGLSYYGPSILTDIDSEVQDAVSKLPVGSLSSDYAFTFASSLIDSLRKNGIIRNINLDTFASTLTAALDHEANISSSSTKTLVKSDDFLQLPKERESVVSISEKTAPLPATSVKTTSTILNDQQNGSSLITEQADNNGTISDIPVSVLTSDNGSLGPGNPLLTLKDKSINMETFEHPTTIVTATSISTDVIMEITSENGFITTFMEAMEYNPITQEPFLKNFTDAIDNPSKLSGLLMKEIKSSLQALSGSDAPYHNGDNSKADNNSEIDDNNKDILLSDVESTLNSTYEVDESFIDSNGSSEIAKTVIMVTPVSNVNPESEESSSSGEILSSAASSELSSDVESPVVYFTSDSYPTSIPTLGNKCQRNDSEYLMLAERVLSISSSSVDFLKLPGFNLFELCDRVNELAELVGISPIHPDNCSEIALVDYLLHVLKVFATKVRTA